MTHSKFALNTSTLMPFELPIIEQINVTAEAGYDGIELWMKDIENYVYSGGTIEELKAALNESNITLVNAIAFFKWTDQDEKVRIKGLEQAKKEMNWLAELGCKAVAAPPTGAVKNISLKTIGAHFAELSKIAEQIGITPYLEFWGHAAKLSTLSEAVYVAMESHLPNVKLLLDPFHMYKGGSHFESLSYVKGENIGIFHVNDYPATPSREKITDQARVLPGDGIAPTKQIVKDLKHIGYQGYFSLEIFPESYSQDETPLEVAKRGLVKMREFYQI